MKPHERKEQTPPQVDFDGGAVENDRDAVGRVISVVGWGNLTRMLGPCLSAVAGCCGIIKHVDSFVY